MREFCYCTFGKNIPIGFLLVCPILHWNSYLVTFKVLNSQLKKMFFLKKNYIVQDFEFAEVFRWKILLEVHCEFVYQGYFGCLFH